MNADGRLNPLLSGALDVIFVGTEPGADSLRLGCYYANPGNSFYADLATTEFTPSRLAPVEFRRLLEFGIGLDDVYSEPETLRERIERASPRAVCFNSKAALTRLSGRRIPSGEARGYHQLRLDGLRELRERIREGN